MRRFSTEILGCPEQEMMLRDSPQRTETASSIDPKLRKYIERYHSEDMALYRQARKIRDRQLEKITVVKGRAFNV